MMVLCLSFNPYFTGLPILILDYTKCENPSTRGFNPYFTELPILISSIWLRIGKRFEKFQSLFYWIYYFYPYFCENPLFISVTEFFSDIKIEII